LLLLREQEVGNAAELTLTPIGREVRPELEMRQHQACVQTVRNLLLENTEEVVCLVEDLTVPAPFRKRPSILR
jgi:hypothetical protein